MGDRVLDGDCLRGSLMGFEGGGVHDVTVGTLRIRIQHVGFQSKARRGEIT